MLFQTWYRIGVCILVGVFASAVSFFRLYPVLSALLFETSDESAVIVIGILSARNHFSQRQILRDTWIGYAQKTKRFHVSFIVGKESCPIPPEYRVDEFSCQPLDISKHYTNDEIDAIQLDQIRPTANPQPTYFSGEVILKFKVLYPIIIRKLGILKDLVHSDNHTSFRIFLVDNIIQEEVVSVRISSRSPGVEQDNYCYKKTEPYHLPKGFEGSIIVRDTNKEESSNEAATRYIPPNTDNGFIQFIQPKWFQMEPELDFASSMKIMQGSQINFIFTIFDPEEYQKWGEQRLTRMQAYAREQQEAEIKLNEESKLYGDLHFVDVVDTYRNISKKMLLFYSWVVENRKFKYLLKTDDDCFLHIDNILEALSAVEKESTSLWWGNFRVGWSVDRFGKWAEHHYASVAYPAFACGTGNVMSYDMISWIASNSRYLHCYQGEDVSLGIWLSAILPSYHNDQRWICDNVCSPNMLASGEHTTKDLEQMWKNWSDCKNPCGCG